MTTVITRSGLEAWGYKPAPNLAGIVDGHEVTWDEILAARREWQAKRLRDKRAFRTVRAFRLMVAYFDQPFMGGWNAFLDDLRGPSYGIWIDRYSWQLKPQLMRLFPMQLPLGSEGTQWELWKADFAHQFKRRMQCGKPVGVHAILWDSINAPRLSVKR